MRRIILCLSIILITSLAFAQNFNSFRNLSTGGALQGEVEKAFDPVDLYSLNGIHLFSGLSNLSANDKIFANDGESYFLLGAASDKVFIKNLKASLFFRFSDVQTPKAIIYNPGIGTTPLTGEGQVHSKWEMYKDTNNNDLYDRYESKTMTLKNSEEKQKIDLFLVLSHKLRDDLVMGYRFGYINAGESKNAARQQMQLADMDSHSYDIVTILKNLQDFDPIISQYEKTNREKGDFSTENTSNKIQNQIAAMLDREKWDLSIYLRNEYGTDKDITDDKASSYEEELSADYYIDKNENFILKDEYKGMINQLFGRFRYKFLETKRFRYPGNLALGLGFRHSFFKSNYTEDTIYEHDDIDFLDDRYTRLATDKYSYDADAKGLGFMGSVVLSYPLNERTMLGMGVLCDINKVKREGDYSFSFEAETSSFTDVSDWQNTSTAYQYEKGDITLEDISSTLSVPVGLEYWFTNNMKWAMRFGSMFKRTMKIEKSLHEPTEITPRTVQDEWADGSVNITHLPYVSELENLSNTKVINSTDLSYGICYQANKNLKIELLGMFEKGNTDLWNTDFIQSLKLSFSLKFD